MQAQLSSIQAQLDLMQVKLDKLLDWKSDKQKETKQRRQQYAEARERRDRGKVSLPTFHVLKARDNRLASRIPGWAAVGMKFGAADNPEGFLAWLCYQWNSTSLILVMCLQDPATFLQKKLQPKY